MHQAAKIFVTGRGHAVRLLLECRVNATAVFIHRDPVTGDLV